MDLSLDVRRDRDGATVDVGGEIDRWSGTRLLHCAFDVMREHGPRLAINLAGVTFMDCGGVQVLLAIRQRAQLLGGQLRVVSTSPPVRRVLEIIGLNTVLAGANDSTVDSIRSASTTRCEETRPWRFFRSDPAAELAAAGTSAVRWRTCTTGWTSG
jgi:anti-anti-sigma factor